MAQIVYKDATNLRTNRHGVKEQEGDIVWIFEDSRTFVPGDLTSLKVKKVDGTVAEVHAALKLMHPDLSAYDYELTDNSVVNNPKYKYRISNIDGATIADMCSCNVVLK